jgi:signal transduction histidine kinase
VFDRFHRLPGNEAPGSGLGLSIVRRIASLHGARITLAEGGDGTGLCVRVSFTRA